MKKTGMKRWLLAAAVLCCILSGCGKNEGQGKDDIADSKTAGEYYELLGSVLQDRTPCSEDVQKLCRKIDKLPSEKVRPEGSYKKYVVYGDFGSGASLSAAMISEMIWESYFAGAEHGIAGIGEFNEIENLRDKCPCDHRPGSSDMTPLSFAPNACICPYCAWVSLG